MATHFQLPEIVYEKKSGLFLFEDFQLFMRLRSSEIRIAAQNLTLSSPPINAQMDLSYRSKLDPPFTLNIQQVTFLANQNLVIPSDDPKE
jgi:hypothetical protein